MANAWTIGDLIRLEGTWVDTARDFAPFDPAAVFCDVITPGNITTSYEYGVDAALQRAGVGSYFIDLPATEVGEWSYHFWSTGDGDTEEFGRFTVYEVAFDSSSCIIPDDDDIIVNRDECCVICGPRCEWIFERLRAWPIIKGGTRVEWVIHPRFSDPKPYTFQLQFGRTGNPMADDWTDVGLSVVDTYFAFDDTKRVYGNFQWTHYRVILSTSLGTYASKPQDLYGSLPRRQWRIAREIERAELLRLRKEAGQEGYLLKRRLFGNACSCLDPQTKELNNPQCPICYGTGYEVGYYPPYPCFYAELGLSGTDSKLDNGQARGTINDAGRTWARMINSPQIFSRDVWVDRDTDFRWEIHSIANIAEVTGLPVIVKAEVRRLPFSHPVYTIDIYDEIPF